MRIDLVVIDGQNDFLDPSGALYVAGADKEAELLADMIDRLKINEHRHTFNKIHGTLDSHQINDSSHPNWWKDSDGNSPPPFTIISSQDVVDGVWVPRLLGKVNIGGKIISYRQLAIDYTQALEAKGRNPLCIWPEHCLIGTWGNNVYPALNDAYANWAKTTGGYINYVTKGTYPFSEHYSAIIADVPEPTVPNTQMNTDLLNDINNADKVVWAGWAGSHCLNWTVRDAINYFGDGENEFIRKSVLLEDASAPVTNPPGETWFTDARDAFIEEFKNRGGEVTTTVDFLN